MAIPFPMIDPVIIELGPVAIRWYSLAYIAGILLGWVWIKKLNLLSAPFFQAPTFSKSALDDLVTWIVLGVILGGRFGYVFFYNFDYYMDHPADILKVWQGGMAFHGGFLGVLAAMWFFARKQGVAFFRVMDLLAAATPIGLFFGRIANFINGELFGRQTDAPWAVIFPGETLGRHPSQLYEAALEGLLLFLVMTYLALRTNALGKPSLLSGVFLLGYGASRMLVEFVREPDVQLGVLTLGMTMGQWLSLPMVVIGIAMIIRASRLPVKAET